MIGMKTLKKHTWKFYALIWLMWFVGMYGMDWVAEHANVGYIKLPFWIYLAEATVFTAILWLIEEKPFKKNK